MYFDDARGVQLSFIYRKACRNAIIAHKNIIRSMQRSSILPAVLLVSIISIFHIHASGT